jgi:predicted RNA-binding Zn ribbon-like protein
MTYPRAITERDRDRLDGIAKEFRVIFSMPQDELARFSNAVLETIRFSPRIMNHGGFGWHIHYYDDDFSFDERIRSNTAMSIMSLIIHGEAERLKTCKAATCDNVFVDTTRNASKVYCDVKTCGNRAHVANFRAKAQNSTPF